MIIACKFLITGEVHGVGYRFFAEVLARDHHISGTVKNLRDGGVEIFAQGTAADLDAFAVRLPEGPPFSVVENVQRSEMPVRDGLTGFEIIR
jgi:acylphosphatase